MMTRILSAALLCVLVFSCTQKPENYKYRPDIEADFEVEIVPSDETLVLSDIVDGYKLIEPKDVLFGYVFKALRYDSLLIVSGMTDDDGLLHLFDTDGNFEEVIIRKGQGPCRPSFGCAPCQHGRNARTGAAGARKARPRRCR